MPRPMSIAFIPILLVGLVACGTPDAGATSSAAAATPTAAPSLTPRPTASPTPPPAECPPQASGEGSACQIVPATANIFGAGHEVAPAPGGGGGGTVPPAWPVPPGATTMRVVEAAGLVVPISGMSGPNDAGGDGIGRTGVASWEGISGISHPDNGMFLVGVFLTDAVPADPPPERLSFNRASEVFEELAPKVAQTFFIGDGAGRTFIVPSGATRLFLGFADAYLYVGEPGWYGNNTGQLAVTVEFESD
jgi:hypothetical protein